MKIDEIKKMLSEISPWPWNVVLYEHGFSAALIDSKVEGNDSKYYVVTGSGYEINLKDANFIATAPEIISGLVKQIELLEAVLNYDDERVLTIEEVQEAMKKFSCMNEIMSGSAPEIFKKNGK